jgi:hypothetical protein
VQTEKREGFQCWDIAHAGKIERAFSVGTLCRQRKERTFSVGILCSQRKERAFSVAKFKYTSGTICRAPKCKLQFLVEALINRRLTFSVRFQSLYFKNAIVIIYVVMSFISLII